MENNIKMENNINDDLSFESIFLITEMLEAMGVENFVDSVEKKLTDFDKEYPKYQEIKEKKNSNNLSIEESKLYKALETQKKSVMLKESLKLILSKLHYAKKQIFLIVADFKNISEDEAKKISFKQLIPILRSLLVSGIWDVIKDNINFKGKEEIFENLKTDLKKTL